VISPTITLFQTDAMTPRELRKKSSVSVDSSVGTSDFGKANRAARGLNAAIVIR
jgi:hypothetical protein